MKTITIKLYSFNELDKTGKEKALTTYRDLNVNFDWWDYEFEDFIELCSYMGIAVIKDTITFSGFYSQGDGSGFSAKVDISKLISGIENQAWKDYAPMQEFPFIQDETDNRVLRLLAKDLLPNEPQIISRQRQYGVVADLGIYVANGNGREHDNVFEELDKLVSSDFLNSLPHIYKSNYGVGDAPSGSALDTDLYMVHIIPHACAYF